MAKISKPSGLTITRNANKFVFSWKRNNSPTAQQFQWSRLLNDKWTSWSSTSIGSGTTSVTKEFTWNKYYPYTTSFMSGVKFRVRGKKSGKWSAWVEKSVVIDIPNKPSLTAALSTEVTNSCKFSWETITNTDDFRPFSNVEWESILQEGYNSSEIKSIANWSDLNGYQSGIGAATDSQDIDEVSTNIADGSHTRWFRVRSRGPREASKWEYEKHVYAQPHQAVITSFDVSETNAGGYLAHVEWNVNEGNDAFPIDNVTVQYAMTVPDEDLAFPSETNWTDANVSVDAGETGAATVVIDTTLAKDQCLFVRVNTKHDTVTTPGVPTLVKLGELKAPTGLSVTKNDSTHIAVVSATNNSDVPDSFLAVKYCPASNPEGLVLGIITNGSANIQCPDWSGESAVAFEVYAVQGDYTISSIGNVTEYRINANMTSETVFDGGAIPIAPANVSLNATDISGTVQVRWDWSWAQANGAEISWADHIDAWESTDQPQTFEVSNQNASKLNISGLETGITWYVRVRLFDRNGENTTYGAYSDTLTIDLSSAPTTPVLKLSAGVIPADGMVTATWAYVSGDGTSQQYAEICEATYENNVLTYGEVIASTKTAQHIDLYAEGLWNAGEVHYLCLRVQSGSGKMSDSWSDPVPIIIADPMNCEITETSLVEEHIETNPRTFSGNPISFETEMEEQFAELKLTLEPIQDLNGYDKPWVGGAGKNKLNNTATSTVVSGVTFTVNSDGSITANGTSTANIFLNIGEINTSGEYILSGCPAGGSNNGYSLRNTNNTFRDYGNGVNFTVAEGESQTIRIVFGGNGGIVANNLIFKPMIRLATEADATYAPYENICPISGNDEVDVVRTGKNIMPSVTKGTGINATTGAQETNANGACTDYALLKFDADHTQITLSGFPTTISHFVAVYNSQQQFLGRSSAYQTASQTLNANSFTYGTAQGSGDIAYYRVSVYKRTAIDPGTIDDVDTANMQVEYGSSPTTYEAYRGNTYTTALGRTVYGGTRDVVSGSLTVGKAMVDLGTLTWTRNETNNFFYSNSITDANRGKTLLSSAYVYGGEKTDGAMASVATGMICNIHTTDAIKVKDTRYTNVAEFTAAVTGKQLVYELATPQTYQLTPQQINTLLGVNNVWSDSDMEVRIAESVRNANVLTELPLIITASGAGDAGNMVVTIKRAEDYFLERPDESEFIGYVGETTAIMQRSGNGSVEITLDDLFGMLDDGAKYNLNVTVYDELGQSASDELDFIVDWEHQALIPTAEIELQDEVMLITPVQPSGIVTGDTCDIYRLSIDKPQLILTGCEWGQDYVDPYPTIGDFGGYRVVFKSLYGDYITEDNILAWTDYGKEEGVYYYTPETIIDFGSEQVRLMLDMSMTSDSEKDFKETKYLGGSITGDWNKAISKSGGLNATTLRHLDEETIRTLHRLADHAGICHVRMPNGSNFYANVDVSFSDDYGNAPITTDVTLSMTRIDGEGLDGMTYEEWSE